VAGFLIAGVLRRNLAWARGRARATERAWALARRRLASLAPHECAIGLAASPVAPGNDLCHVPEVRIRLAVLSSSVLALALLACSGGSSNNYVGAARAAAFGVGAAAVHRAATGYCWGDCVAGTVCNRDTGLCERAPEEQETLAPMPPPSASAADAPAVAPASSCDHLCRSDETCVLGLRGDVTCEPKAGVELSPAPASLPPD
jgi:hypothetical protein